MKRTKKVIIGVIVIGIVLVVGLTNCTSFPVPESPDDTLLVIDIAYFSENTGTNASSIFGYLEAKIEKVDDPSVSRIITLRAEKDYKLVQKLPPGQYYIPEVNFVYKESSKKQPTPTFAHTFYLEHETVTICPFRFTYTVQKDGSLTVIPENIFAYEALVQSLSKNEEWASWKLQEGAGGEISEALQLFEKAYNDGDKQALGTYISNGVVGNFGSTAAYSNVLITVVGAEHEPKSEQVNIVGKILDAGADPNLIYKEVNGNSFSALDISILFKNSEISKMLVEYGADLNKNSPLAFAFETNQIELAQFLLQKGADPNVSNYKGQTALMFAAKTGSVDIISKLLDAGADPNIQDPGGWSPLIIAAGTGKIEPVQILLDGGADPSLQTSDGYTALDLAKNNGDEELIQLLVNL